MANSSFASFVLCAQIVAMVAGHYETMSPGANEMTEIINLSDSMPDADATAHNELPAEVKFLEKKTNKVNHELEDEDVNFFQTNRTRTSHVHLHQQKNEVNHVNHVNHHLSWKPTCDEIVPQEAINCPFDEIVPRSMCDPLCKEDEHCMKRNIIIVTDWKWKYYYYHQCVKSISVSGPTHR